MMMKRWSVTDELLRVHLTQVFSGGACNIITADGTLLRNSERDRINDWITEQEIVFFDPQIHPATHGYEYEYAVHHPLEIAARQAAKVNLYEISPFTFGGITALEIAVDHIQRHEPTVLYYSDGSSDADEFPPHRNGNPIFTPGGIATSEIARRAHYREFRKIGTNMRRYIVQLARDLDSLTVTFGEAARSTDTVITPGRMHAVDMFVAAVKAANGERVILNFSGDSSSRDDRCRDSRPRRSSIRCWMNMLTKATSSANRSPIWCKLACFCAWSIRRHRRSWRWTKC
jgi:hypothetical protein